MTLRSYLQSFSRNLITTLALAAALWLGASVHAAPRDVLVCTTGSVSPELKKAAADFVAKAAETPLLKALKAAGEYEAVKAQNSDELLDPKKYDFAAHNHLIVIGLASKDALLKKVWGYTVTIDEERQSLYSQGWGYLKGDIGWIECDRNPFLHSQRIKSAPEGTILVKISGDSEAGVLAALAAFQEGLLGGFVPAGKISRPQTTILDRDPNPAAPPAKVPDTVSVNAVGNSGKTGTLAGWYDVPENEYRAIEEAAGGLVPQRIWRLKYIAPGILEEKSIIRWLGSVHRMAFGNAVNLIRFASAKDAQQAAEKMAERDKYKPIAGKTAAWSLPIGNWKDNRDEVIEEPYWDITLTVKGQWVVLSTLPAEQTQNLAKVLP